MSGIIRTRRDAHRTRTTTAATRGSEAAFVCCCGYRIPTRTTILALVKER